ncbi:ribose-phosphate pyrophosphokinase [Candidatus Pacearchaeota archaeon]|nr:ribose-phosphate pyrophosphokinase [Candidatus Pacearchaeota archaeon]
MYVFSTPQYRELAEEVASKLDCPMGGIEVKDFADGEIYHRIGNPRHLKDQDVILIGGTTDDTEIMNMYHLASALVHCQIKKLHLVLPYFGYSTMERAVKEGEVVKAKNIARMFSGLPQATRGNFIYMIDLHTEGIPFYFEGQSHVVHLYAKEAVRTMLCEIGKPEELVLASTDAGRAKWVESLANEFDMQAAFVLKRRDDKGTEVTAINADVKGKTVVIYDDMIRSGGSIINAAKAYLEAGADKVYATCTHGIYCDDANAKLRLSGVIEGVFATNTHSEAFQSVDGFFRLVSVGDLIAKGLKI